MNSSLLESVFEQRPSVIRSTEPKLCKFAGLFNSLRSFTKNGTCNMLLTFIFHEEENMIGVSRDPLKRKLTSGDLMTR